MVTSSTASEVARRRGRPPKGTPPAGERQYFFVDFARSFFPALHAATGVQFPNPMYQRDPVKFAKDILGIEPWSRQVDVLEALADPTVDRIAVKSGHKTGKSMTCAIVALWFYCSFENARCVMTSTTARQVDEILWREIRMVHARSGKCVDCKRREKQALDRGEILRIAKPCPHSALIAGDVAETARSGLRSHDFREIVGFTAKQAEAVAGISGANVLYIVDEASGVAELIFEAIEGNRAGGAKLLLFGNPTQNEGTFYDAFNSKERFYRGFTISSEETPNAVTGRDLVPGLATRDWIEQKREEWGAKSSLFKIRVLGAFAEHEQGRIFSVHAIGESEARWLDTSAEGRLYIGLDPAGEAGTGDEVAFAVRRGLKCMRIVTHPGLNEAGHLVQTLLLLKHFKLPRETPVVVIDSDGSVGSKVYFAFRAYADANPGVMELVRMRGSDDSQRQPELYPKMRDALTASLHAWFEAGGAIPEDAKLAKELHSMEWKQRADGKQKVTDKLTLRKILGRSPDRYDALALSCWEPLSLIEESAGKPAAEAEDTDDYFSAGQIDPYGGTDAFRR